MRDVPDTGGVYLVPAFVGLGAPYWDPHARGTIVGLTRGPRASSTSPARPSNAMAYQTRDVLEAMQQDAGLALPHLKVDGGASANAMLMQFQADHARRAGAAPGRRRDDRARRGVPGRPGRGLLGRARRRAPQLGARP